MVTTAYEPAGRALPSTLTSVLVVKRVASFAPVRHGSFHGTSLPHTSRPFTPGRW